MLLLLCLAACEPVADETPDAGGTDAGFEVDPELFNFPVQHAIVSGGFSDGLLRLSPLSSRRWTLSVEGAPAGVELRFAEETIEAGRLGTPLFIDTEGGVEWSGLVTIRARSGETTLELPLGIDVRERLDAEPDFEVLVRSLVEFRSDGLRPLPGDREVRVVSLGGFRGEVHLVARDGVVEPGKVQVEPGKPGRAVARGGDGLYVHGAFGRRVKPQTGGLYAEPDRNAPRLNFTASARLWAKPGMSVSGGGRLLGFNIPETPVLSLDAPSDLVSTATILFPDGWRLDVQASLEAESGVVVATAKAGDFEVKAPTRIVIPRAPSGLAGSSVVAAPMAGGVLSDLLVVEDSVGVEFRLLRGNHWHVAKASEGFVPMSGAGLARHQTGVFGGRVIAEMTPNGLVIIEKRSDHGTLYWPTIAGVQGVPSFAYDDSNELRVATTISPGLVTVWRRTHSGQALPESEGLPKTIISRGPWLAAGRSAPVLAFEHEDELKLMRFESERWTAMPDSEASARYGFSLRMDSQGRAVVAWIEESGGLRVRRFESDAWSDLGLLPAGAGRYVLEAELQLDEYDHPMLLWTELLHPLVNLLPPGKSLAEVRFSRHEGTGWSEPVSLRFDAGAIPAMPRIALTKSGDDYLLWTEDGELVVLGLPL